MICEKKFATEPAKRSRTESAAGPRQGAEPHVFVMPSQMAVAQTMGAGRRGQERKRGDFGLSRHSVAAGHHGELRAKMVADVWERCLAATAAATARPVARSPFKYAWISLLSATSPDGHAT